MLGRLLPAAITDAAAWPIKDRRFIMHCHHMLVRIPMTDFLRLDGQTAIVTGAATGIGAAIATRLADAGARVAIADLDAAAAGLMAASLAGSFAVQVNVAEAVSVQAAIDEVIRQTGRIDILV